MGMLGDKIGLSTGQFSTFDPLERHAPLSRYGTQHPLDKTLWKYDRVKEIGKKLKGTKGKAESVLTGTAAAQKGGGGGSHAVL